jgi:acyl-CoA reductase-like NAD-dependent aldehyde dehydrogenase
MDQIRGVEIAGRTVQAHANVFNVISPYTEVPIAGVVAAGPADVDAAVNVARTDSPTSMTNDAQMVMHAFCDLAKRHQWQDAPSSFRTDRRTALGQSRAHVSALLRLIRFLLDEWRARGSSRQPGGPLNGHRPRPTVTT